MMSTAKARALHHIKIFKGAISSFRMINLRYISHYLTSKAFKAYHTLKDAYKLLEVSDLKMIYQTISNIFYRNIAMFTKMGFVRRCVNFREFTSPSSRLNFSEPNSATTPYCPIEHYLLDIFWQIFQLQFRGFLMRVILN